MQKISIATVLIDNIDRLEIMQPLVINSDEERLVWECTINIVPITINDSKKNLLNNIIDPTTRRKATVSIWIDGNLFFTGFCIDSQTIVENNQISCSIKLSSKTIDIMESTYIPPAYDKARGISQFSTDGKLSFIDIIKQSVLSLSWNIVDPFGTDGEQRLSDYKSIAIIDKTKKALTVIPIDKKTNETTEQSIKIEEGQYFDSNILNAAKKTLNPRITEKVGAFVSNLANELGYMLTTNEYGDIVITNAASDEAEIDPLKQFLYLSENQNNNITRIAFMSNDSNVYHTSIRVDQNGKLSAGKSKARATVEQGQIETGQSSGVSTTGAMIPSINANTRETRVLVYAPDETVNVQQQLANQEMFAKTQEARATNFEIKPISLYYESTAANPMPSDGTPIRPGDLVYINIWNPLNDEIYKDEIRYVSQVGINIINKDNIDVSIELKLPNYFANPSIRPRRVSKPRALSSF